MEMRIQTARNLGVYAGFSYDLSAVSAYWSITCIEMALWNRSQEIDPSVHNTIVITKFHLEAPAKSGQYMEALGNRSGALIKGVTTLCCFNTARAGSD